MMAECTIVVANRHADLWQKFTDGLDKVDADVKFKVVRVDGGEPGFTYAKAMNKGLSIVDTEYVCFMNDDAYPITEGWMRKLINAVESGFIGVSPVEIIKESNHKSAAKYPPIIVIKSQRKFPGNTSTLNGFCMLMKTGSVRKVGGWDEEYEHFYEDNDLSIRLELLGWNAYVRCVEVKHAHKQTTKRCDAKEITKAIAKSKSVFKKKWGKTHKGFFTNTVEAS